MATTYLSPVGNEQQNDSNGAPLSGGLIYTYQAGTTTPIATYMDNSGAVGQANPIVLNSAGLPSNPIWLPAGQAVKFVFQKADGSIARPQIDNVLGVNDPSNSSNAPDQWLIYTGGSFIYLSATSLALVGDQTVVFHIGRRIRTVNTGGTVYSTITASSYNATTGRTTLTVVNDSGAIDVGVSQVSYGLLSFNNPSSPSRLLKAANGYKIHPDGLIEQWGATTMSSTGVATSFPIPFPNACFVVTPTHNGTSPASVGGVSYTATTSAVTLYSQGAGPFQCNYRATGY